MRMRSTRNQDVCNKNLFEQIIWHVKYSLDRINAGNADCYVFDVMKDRKNWIGNWDCLEDLVDKEAQYIYVIDENRIYRNERFERFERLFYL